jgi:PAS domain S-box-containing protein
MAVQLARIAIEAKRDDQVLSMVFEGAPDGILITDLTGAIVMVNLSFARMLGYTPAELLGRSVADITPAQGNPRLAEELGAPGNQEIVAERRYRGKSGGILWAREHSTLRRDPAGQPRRVVTRVEKMTAARNDPLERLSRREREVLDLVVAGGTSKEIGARLGIAPASVDTYRSRIMSKLGTRDLAALVRFAIRHGVGSL